MSRPNVIKPPEIVDLEGGIIFLNGPVQGAPDWQADAIDLLTPQLSATDTIASPRWEYQEGTFVYENQVDWETHYRELAHEIGVNVFWLAAQITETPGRSYAQTSRIEIGETIATHHFTGAKLVVGVENGFGNARYIKRRLSQKCPDVLVTDTLEETCSEAVRLLGTVATR